MAEDAIMDGKEPTNQEPTGQESTGQEMTKKRLILVVGDWFIDENWIVSRQRLHRSSNTGKTHYKASDKLAGKQILSCGGLAILLKGLTSYKPIQNNSDFIGMGAWNPDDDNFINCMMCPDDNLNKQINPFRLRGPKE